MGQLFEQLVRVAVQSGLAPLLHVCVDGTKIEAHASKHKAMTYGRMQETEKRLQAEIQALLRRAEKLDKKEDQRYGAANGDDLPAELALREKRLAKIRAAMAALEAEAGFAQFLLRGLSKVQWEWTFMAIGHNLRKLWAFPDLVLRTIQKMTAQREEA